MDDHCYCIVVCCYEADEFYHLFCCENVVSDLTIFVVILVEFSAAETQKAIRDERE